MSNIPSLKPKDLIRLLIQKGFVLDRTSGSHQVWLHPGSNARVVVPFHKKDLPKGTIYSIMKQAGLDKKDL